MKHIRMSRAQADKWLAALRNGEYTQGRGALYLESTRGYCCLGVLQHCLSGKVDYRLTGQPAGYPSPSWMKEKGIRFLDAKGDLAATPYIQARDTYVVRINDSPDSSFPEIADLLEAEIEYTD